MKIFLVAGFFASSACLFGQDGTGLGQMPEIVSGPAAPGELASKKLASDFIPLDLNQKLGSLTSGLIAYFAMDDKHAGGLTWSRDPIGVYASHHVQIKAEGARKYADFSQSGAVVLFSPALALPHHYTLAAWIQAPAPQGHGVIWHGSGGLQLGLDEMDLSYWISSGGKYAEFAAPLTGWYHMAVEFDGQKTEAFMNGRMVGFVKGNISRDLEAIGNNPNPANRGFNMASGIDEMYIYDRNLTPEELLSLARAGKPSY